MFLTAYHSQTDESSEAINQFVEIALRHWLTTLKQFNNWPLTLSCLQAALNNSTKYSFINLSTNEVLFKFCTCEVLDLLQVDELNIIKSALVTELVNTVKSFKKIKLTFVNQYQSAHIDIKDVIVFATLQIKHHYDKKHITRFFDVNNMVNIRLHCEYTLSGLTNVNKKLEQQFVDLICILKWVKRLAYWLDILSSWKIHDIISVAHLEPATRSEDNSYNCSHSDKSDTIIVNENEKYEIRQLLCKHTYWQGCEYITEYLAHWVEYDPEFDSWVNCYVLI